MDHVAPQTKIFSRWLVLVRVVWLPLGVCGVLLAWAMPSRMIASKVLGMLAMPAGLAWLALLALAAWPGLPRAARVLVVLTLATYTLAGNAWLGAYLLGRLEAPYAVLPSPTEKLDVLCVLGGGSSARPDGGVQLGAAGDRLLVPARMYLTGMSEHLVASGLNVTDANGNRSLADDTANVWEMLGIPAAAITRLATPRTTREEIHAYKDLVARHQWRRVGVCSSAWHLRRVESICRAEGLTIVPVPADFLSGRLPCLPLYAIPQARGFQNVQKALWEYLGAFTGG